MRERLPDDSTYFVFDDLVRSKTFARKSTDTDTTERLEAEDWLVNGLGSRHRRVREPKNEPPLLGLSWVS